MDLNFWKKDNSHEVEKNNSDFEYQYSESEEVETSSSNSDVVESPEYYQVEPADPEKAKFYNNISRWALYLGVFLMPLFFLPWTQVVLEANKYLLLVGVVSIGLVSWLLGVVSSGFLAWRNNPIDKALLVLLGVFALVTVFSVDSFKSLFGFSGGISNSLTAFIALTILYFLVVNNTEDGGKTIGSLAGFSIILALIYGLLQIFDVHLLKFSFATSKAFNSVGSVNTLGVLAAISLPFFSKSKINLKYLNNIHLEKIGVVLSLVVLIILNWWVMWTIAITGMVAMIIFESFSGGRFRINKLLLPMTVVVLGVFMMVVNLNLSALKSGLPVEVAPSFNLSKDITISVFKEKLIFGYGLENFSIAFDRYGAGRLSNSTLSDTRFFDSTSEAFTLLVQGGLVMVVGLTIFMVFLVLMFKRFQKISLVAQDREALKENTGTLATFAALIAAFFLYPFNLTMMFLFYLFMGLSVLIIYGKERKEFNIEEKTSLSLGSSLGFIGGLILVLVGVYFSSTIYMSKVKYAQAIDETDRAEAASLLVDAINWNNKDDRYYRAASQVALQLLNNELNQPATPERDARIQNYVSTSISLSRRATEITPRESLNWANLGFIYQNLLNLVDGVDKLSEEAYLKAAELRPGDPIYTYRIGMLYLAKFDLYSQLVAARRVNPNAVVQDAQLSLEKARDYLKQTTELSSNFGLAIYNLGVVYERQGEVAEAIEQLEKVAPANNNQPSLAFELGLLYYRAGRKNDSFNALQRAVVLAPNFSNARWYLALIYEERGDLDSAVEQLEKILELPENENNPIVTEKLTELMAGVVKIPPGDILDEEPIE